MALSAAWVKAPEPTIGRMAAGDAALGFDFGTSGVRAAVVDARGAHLCEPLERRYDAETERKQRADDWVDALHELLDRLPDELRPRISRIAISGTSSTVLLCDAAGVPVPSRGPPRMYDFSVAKQAPADSGVRALAMLSACAPPRHIAAGATSSLAKLLAWHLEAPLASGERLAHQADYIAAQLLDRDDAEPFCSDWHNALKLGFDVGELRYPPWMEEGELGAILGGRLPRVVPPGASIAPIGKAASARWKLPADCIVCGGTTDSNAAFLASGASQVGDAVTSLGSTLALKMLSSARVDDASRGVYSHRLGDMWLAGGASNVGCAVLREESFSTDELVSLSERIDPLAAPPQPGYYPLPSAVTGERFPVADDSCTSVLEPRPASRAEFLHSILHGIARVEARGYEALAELGASRLTRVLTCGGGAANDVWMAMRQQLLGVPTSRAPETDACVGVALLASRGG